MQAASTHRHIPDHQTLCIDRVSTLRSPQKAGACCWPCAVRVRPASEACRSAAWSSRATFWKAVCRPGSSSASACTYVDAVNQGDRQKAGVCCWPVRRKGDAGQGGMKVCSLVIPRHVLEGSLQAGLQQRQCLHACTCHQQASL